MAMYSVRVNIDDTDLLNLIDFSEIGKGLLKLFQSLKLQILLQFGEN